jgi:hypothetical protein
MKRVTLVVLNSWHESQEIELGVFSNDSVAKDFANSVKYLMTQENFSEFALSNFDCHVHVSNVVSNDILDPWQALEDADNMIGLRRS